MATTKIWAIKRQLSYVLQYAMNADKTEASDDLDSVLHYIGRRDKTDLHQFVSGIRCTPDSAYDMMMSTKREYGKDGGTMAFHGYQSFAPGEVTPEEAHQIGVQLAGELWEDRFQVVVATHLDRGHLHNHFVVNSVSCEDGKRFHSDAQFLHRMREASDRLCREHGLSVIQEPKQGATRHHGEYAAEEKGVPTWRSLIQSDIDRSVAASMTEQQFFRALQDMGYDYKLGQDISVRPPGKERFFRLNRNLGEEYSMDGIRRRLGRNLPEKPQPITQPMPIRHYRLKGKFLRRQKSHLRRMYLYYCYRLGVFQKHPQSTAKMHFLLREDLRNLDKHTQEIRLLHTYRLDTDVQLLSFQSEKQQALDSLVERRKRLRNRLRRPPSEEAATRTRQEIAALSKEISQTRKEVKLCSDILSHSSEIPQKLARIHEDEQQQRTHFREAALSFPQDRAVYL
jgi:hypothetical protein